MSTLFVTASGKVVDIAAPKAADIDFADVAEHLSKVARYNGGTPGEFYSVAQHLVVGANWIIGESGLPNREHRRQAAAYFLLHDAHEYVLQDETTPKKRALDGCAAEFGSAAGMVRKAFARLTERWDAAIHEAAGLLWLPPKEIATLVHEVDVRLLLAEWAALHGGHSLIGDYRAAPLPVAIRPWPWEQARLRLQVALIEFLPAWQKKDSGGGG